jgi:hypothetical protein
MWCGREETTARAMRAMATVYQRFGDCGSGELRIAPASHKLTRVGTYDRANNLTGVGLPYNDNAASPGCPASRPSANDATGRLRALWVSSVGGAAAGDILKLTYTWQADRIAATDTCLLGTTTPRTETFKYDATLRLTGAGRPTGNFAATGGAFSSRSYSYDGRGNRTSTVADGIAITSSYATSQVDRLTRLSAGPLYGYTFSYDGDGRVTTKVGPIDSTGCLCRRPDTLRGQIPAAPTIRCSSRSR